MSSLDEYLDHAEKDVVPKMRSSAYVMTLSPDAGDEIDAKIALETGLAVLMDKPLMVMVTEGRTIPPGLRRIADLIVELPGPITSMEGQMAIQQGLTEMQTRFPGGKR